MPGPRAANVPEAVTDMTVARAFVLTVVVVVAVVLQVSVFSFLSYDGVVPSLKCQRTLVIRLFSA
jgi:hypothetical protein